MNEQLIKSIGQFLKITQAHHLKGLFFPKDNIRITVTHHVRQQDINNFESIIKLFMKKRRIITPEEFFKLNAAGDYKGKLLLMTFDDGLLSSYEAVKKILAKYGIKAIFFIPTKILEFQTEEEMRNFAADNLYFKERKAGSFSREEFVTVSREQMVELHKEGHKVFPHTHTHCPLKDIADPMAIEQEIIRPRKILENLLQSEINVFAFPVGTERVVSSYVFPSIKQEYQYCFSSLAGINTAGTDRYFYHRDCIHAHFDLDYVSNILEGVYDTYYLYKMFLLKKAFGVPEDCVPSHVER